MDNNVISVDFTKHLKLKSALNDIEKLLLNFNKATSEKEVNEIITKIATLRKDLAIDSIERG